MRSASPPYYPLVVLKRGAPAARRRKARARWRVAAPDVEAIDTTGAGDAFVAAFLAARLEGAEIGQRSSAPSRRGRGGAAGRRTAEEIGVIEGNRRNFARGCAPGPQLALYLALATVSGRKEVKIKELTFWPSGSR